jgi:hypothetical protein
MLMSVVGVEHIGNPTNMPARIILAPDCLAQSKRRLYGWNTIYFAWKKGIPVDVFPIK